MNKIFLVLLLFTFVSCASNPKYKTKNLTEESSPVKKRVLRKIVPKKEESTKFSQKGMEEEIKTWLGTPYHWGGTTKEGVDCSGFVLKVFHNSANQKLPRVSRDMYKVGKAVPRDKLKFGDLVFFQGFSNKRVSHVGIFLGEEKFAHASSTYGVIYSHLYQSYYKKRYIGAKRVLN
ncbi:MAG: NlpC/P60 family protein [Calditrichaeota bacterium]|nr:MAG: NlpC/P60 family protein [Calditrichota bacterium]